MSPLEVIINFYRTRYKIYIIKFSEVLTRNISLIVGLFLISRCLHIITSKSLEINNLVVFFKLPAKGIMVI